MPIVVIDDDRLVAYALTQRLKSAGFRRVHPVTDPERAEAVCLDVGADLVICDVHMPVMDGLQVLRVLRQSLPDVPILLLTADSDPEITRRAFERGAREFLTKSADPIVGLLRVVNLLQLRALELELREENRSLDERVRERTRELDAARIEVLERLAVAAEYRDDDTHQHALRIGRTAALLAAGLGLDAQYVNDMRRAAALHDVGKIAIPDAILLKPGRLDEGEWELVQTHTTAGAEMLSGSPSPLLQLAQEIALTHHERWDGGGYPNGLSRLSIPQSGRIVAVADVFDALVHSRPYKKPWPVDAAVAEIMRQSGHHFDPDVVAAFAELDHEALLHPVAPTARARRR